MSISGEICSKSTPVSLRPVDWKKEVHRRVVMACLVRGAYKIEHDRQENKKQGPQADTIQWWDSFHFQLKHIIENDGKSVIGCIYELNSHFSAENSPRIVIAFRGTIIKKPTVLSDFKDILKSIRNELDKTPRFRHAIAAVEKTVYEVGSQNVWLTGHSLGSALALLIGKIMADKDHLIETYLFNPPFFFVSEERIKNERLKLGIHVTHSAFKVAAAGLVDAVKGNDDIHIHQNKFLKLSSWVPNLFVNSGDDLCSGYIGYFGGREKMKNMGLGNFEKIATQSSVRSCLRVAIGKESNSEVLIHQLPSANLFINRTIGEMKITDFRKAHGIVQWCDVNLSVENKLYLFSDLSDNK